MGMKIGKSIAFEVENQKMKVKTLKKKIGFGSNLGHIRVKKKTKSV